MQSEYLIKDGCFAKTNEKIFYSNNRAFHYGDGCFETILAYNEQIPLLHYHIDRLKRAAETLGLELPKEFNSIENLKKIILRLARKNKLYKTFKIKISIYRKADENFFPSVDNTNYTIETFYLEQTKFPTNNKTPYTVEIYNEIPKTYSIISPFKTKSHLNYALAEIFAWKKRYQNALIINNHNFIIEAANANIFIFADQKLYTPPITDGCVDGVMRKYLIKELLPKMNLEVIEKSITEEDLKKADEFFLTNAIKGACAVTSFREKRYFDRLAKLINEKLNTTLFY